MVTIWSHTTPTLTWSVIIFLSGGLHQYLLIAQNLSRVPYTFVSSNIFIDSFDSCYVVMSSSVVDILWMQNLLLPEIDLTYLLYVYFAKCTQNYLIIIMLSCEASTNHIRKYIDYFRKIISWVLSYVSLKSLHKTVSFTIIVFCGIDWSIHNTFITHVYLAMPWIIHITGYNQCIIVTCSLLTLHEISWSMQMYL